MTVPKTVSGQMRVLVGVCGAVFLCVVPWSVLRLGNVGVLTALVSAVCCLVPGCLLFLLQNRLGRNSLVVPLLIGVAARGGGFLLGVVGLHVWWQVPLEPLVLVFLAFYLAALACETWVLSPPSGKLRSEGRHPDSTIATEGVSPKLSIDSGAQGGEDCDPIG